MGCDIHCVWQARKGDKWVPIQHDYDRKRHYMLFAWLADVRNGYGFAGVPTHDKIINCVAPGRGLPDDFKREMKDDEVYDVGNIAFLPPWEREHYTKNPIDRTDDPCRVWMGDHNHTWALGSEILAAAEKLNVITYTGVVTREFYDKWDGVTPPESFYGGISGRDIVVNNAGAVTPATTHVQISWKEGMADNFKYFLDEVRKRVEEHGDIRIVMGFDS